MKYLSIPLAIVVIIIGIALLIAGYSASVRPSSLEQAAAAAAAEKPAPNETDLQRQFKNYYKYLDQKETALTGTLQSCTGWLLIGLGTTTLALLIQHERRMLKKLHKDMIR